MDATQKFYKSKEWETFRKVIIAERTEEDGFVRCAECGQPILKKYDLIIHHIDELSEANVFDANVALNPDKVVCVHFKCHNKIHERFGFNKTGGRRFNPQKKVFIVYGSPCSGKTTWVNEVATGQDIIVDLDSIYECISNLPRYSKTDNIKGVAFEVRNKLYDVIKYRSGAWRNAYVLTTGARSGDRERLKQRIGADECILIDTPKEVCLERAKATRPPAFENFINLWFNTYQPD